MFQWLTISLSYEHEFIFEYSNIGKYILNVWVVA